MMMTATTMTVKLAAKTKVQLSSLRDSNLLHCLCLHFINKLLPSANATISKCNILKPRL